MGLWGVLLEFVRTAATHAAPHVAKSAVEMARERMGANRPEAQNGDPLEQLNQVFAAIDQRFSAAEQRAAAAEEQLATVQEHFARKWDSARIWVIALVVWNAVLTGLLVYLLVVRK